MTDAKTAVVGLRRALMDVFAALGVDPSRPQEIAREFKLDKTLTWKISRVIRDDDAMDAISHVPGRKRMQSLLSALRAADAPDYLLEATAKAFDEFERLVDLHSGDRETLDVMVTNVSSDVGRRRQETFRKAGFQSNAAVWGVKAQLQIATNFVVPSEVPGKINTATVCGLVGLQRLRANLPWAVAKAVTWDAEQQGSSESVGPVGLGENGILIEQFCSSQVSELRTIRVGGQDLRYELPEGEVGRRDAVSVFLGWKWMGLLSAYGQYEGEMGEHGMYMSTPVETAIIEVWIHRSLAFNMDPKARVYSDLPSGPKYPQEGLNVGLLPIGGEVVDLGFGAAGAASPEYPRGADLLTHGASCLGVNADDLRGYRFRLKYPPVPTLVMLRHSLWSKPQ